jgi:predicted phosphodiesterase
MPESVLATLPRQRVFFGAFFVSFGVAVAACSASSPVDGATDLGSVSPSDPATTGPALPANGAAPSAGACKSCIQDSDCNPGSVCGQFAGDSFCAKACPTGNECSADTACMPVSGADGTQSSACIPRSDVCGASVGPPSAGGDGAAASSCGSLAGPSVSAACACAKGHACAANGCYGGWYCNSGTNRCQAPPPGGCAPGGGGGGGTVTVDAGGPLVGSVGKAGGSISRLYFAVIGDTRPPVINDTSAYPSTVITKIYSDIEALSPRPAFAVSTGDYLFSTGNGTQAAPQLDLYLTARSKFSNIVFPTMGNHECTGAVTSNCGTGNAEGLTNNYSAFLSKLLAPLGQTTPNYVIDINATDNSWTSKFVFVAGNAWSSSDATWLENALSKTTTYTFVVRHEPKAASNAPGCKGSEAIMANHPYTLAIVGHTHTYGKTGPKQVTIGNGGAPLTGGANYGFGLLQQRTDGAIQVDMIDSSTGGADTAFRFALHPDGSPAP